MTSINRQMVDVSKLNLKCDDCGKEIQELPSGTSTDRPLYCCDCVAHHRIAGPPGGSGFRGSRF